MQVALEKSEIINLDGGPGGLVVYCTGGLLWITNGNGCDYLVKPGVSLRIGSRGTALAEALEKTEIQLERPELATEHAADDNALGRLHQQLKFAAGRVVTV